MGRVVRFIVYTAWFSAVGLVFVSFVDDIVGIVVFFA